MSSKIKLAELYEFRESIENIITEGKFRSHKVELSGTDSDGYTYPIIIPEGDACGPPPILEYASVESKPALPTDAITVSLEMSLSNYISILTQLKSLEAFVRLKLVQE